jgi:hypothetical protein
VQNDISDPEKFAKDMGITLRQGRWAPDQSLLAKRQAQAQGAGEETKRLQGNLLGVIIICITLMIVISVIGIEASCLFSLLLFFMFVVIVAIVMFLSNHVKPAPYIDWAERYPVVEVDRTIVHFNSREIDFPRIGGVQVDRYHNEFLILDKTLTRREIALDGYTDPTEMVLALQGAFEANGVRVIDKYPEWNGPSSVRPITDPAINPRPRTQVYSSDSIDEPVEVTPIVEEQKTPPQPVHTADIPSTSPVAVTKGPVGQVCSKCGAPISEDLIECPNCGSSI